MSKYFYLFLNALEYFLFPRSCLGCRKEDELLCQSCVAKLILNRKFPKSDFYFCLSYSEPVVRKSIARFKYSGLKILGEVFGQILYQGLLENFSEAFSISNSTNWIIVPVPLSRKRFLKRGFNQSEILARELSNLISIPSFTGVLLKIKETPTQVSLKSREKRLKNLDGVFLVKNSSEITDKNIILIDDVITTGSTLLECKKTLRSAGAKHIICTALAG